MKSAIAHLRIFAARVADVGEVIASTAKRAYAIFNNCYQNFGIMNANTMAAILRGKNPQCRSAGGFHAAGAADRFHRMGWRHIGDSDDLAKACASNRARTRKGVWWAREVQMEPSRRRGGIARDLAVRG